MKKHTLICSISLALLALAGCDADDSNTSTTDTSNVSDATNTSDTATQGDASTDSNSDTSTPPVCAPKNANLSAYIAGTFPNALTVEGDFAYVVNSGDNTIQRIDLASGSSEPAFVDVGENQNPYDLAIDGDRIYITSLFTGSLTVASLSTGQIISQTAYPELISPQDIVVTNEHIFVANTEFVYGSEDTTFGSLAIFTKADTPTLIKVIPTTQPNPQFVFVHGNSVYTVNSGLVSYDENFISTPVGASGVDKFLLAGIETASLPTQNIALGDAQGFVGNPGAPAIFGDTLYLGSGTGPVLFQVDLQKADIVRGTQSPIEVRPLADANALMVPFAGPGGLLYVADFNQDLLHTLDEASLTPCAEPLAVGTSDELLEGPLSLDWHGSRGLLLNSVAATIVSFDAP